MELTYHQLWGDSLEITPGTENIQSVFLKRVTACVRPNGIRTILFEFLDGRQSGINTYEFERYGGDKNWKIVQDGDYIVSVSGHQLAQPSDQLICFSLTLKFASGKEITFAGTDKEKEKEWKGEPFSYTTSTTEDTYSGDMPLLVTGLDVQRDDHPISTNRRTRIDGLTGIITTMHLPLTPYNSLSLPTKYGERLFFVLPIIRKLDEDRKERGAGPVLGTDLWWRILSFIRACDL